MSDQVSLTVNGASISVPSGATVAVAVALAGQPCRTSVTGEPRAVMLIAGFGPHWRAVLAQHPNGITGAGAVDGNPQRTQRFGHIQRSTDGGLVGDIGLRKPRAID